MRVGPIRCLLLTYKKFFLLKIQLDNMSVSVVRFPSVFNCRPDALSRNFGPPEWTLPPAGVLRVISDVCHCCGQSSVASLRLPDRSAVQYAAAGSSFFNYVLINSLFKLQALS